MHPRQSSRVTGEDFDDGQVMGFLPYVREPTTGGEPLADSPVVLDLAGLGFPMANVEVVALDRNDGLPRSLVVTVLRSSVGRVSACAILRMKVAKTVCTVLPSAIRAALPSIGR